MAESRYDDIGFVREIAWKADIPSKWILVALGGALIGLWGFPFTAGVRSVFVLYAMSNIALMWFFGRRHRSALATQGALLGSYVADVVFVSFLIYHTGGVGSDLYLLYALLVFKCALYYAFARMAVYVSFLLFPLYTLVLYLSSGSFYFLREKVFLVRYSLLTLVVFVGIYTAWLMDSRRKQIRALYESLRTEKQRTLEKMRQSVAVNEVAKSLVSTLDVQQVMQQVVDVLGTIFDIECCVAVLIDEDNDKLVGTFGRGLHDSAVRALAADLDATGLVRQVLDRKQPVAAAELDGGGALLEWMRTELPGDVARYVLAPLVAKDRLMGILLLSEPPGGLGWDHLDLVMSFAHFVALVLENAQLYRRMDEKRAESEAVLSSIGDGVLVVDAQCDLVMLNPVAEAIFESLRPAAIGQHLPELVANESLIGLLREVLQESPDALLSREVVASASEDGQAAVYEAAASPLAGGEGHNRGAVVVLRDITRKKELDLMKSNFMSVVSHELKTPLHSIKGFVDVILMGKAGKLNELQRDFLETAREQAIHLQALIDDLLDFATFESGGVHLRLEQVSVPELVDEITSRLSPLAREAEVVLYSSVPSDLPAIRADKRRLLQVLDNLVGNAIEFTPAGGEVRLEAFDTGTHIQIQVVDTGIGIPPNEREKVFERFYQVDSSMTRPHRGVGLGLAVCKYIADAHSGRIWVEDNQPTGSVFCFTLPRHLEDGEELALDFSVARL